MHHPVEIVASYQSPLILDGRGIADFSIIEFHDIYTPWIYPCGLRHIGKLLHGLPVIFADKGSDHAVVERIEYIGAVRCQYKAVPLMVEQLQNVIEQLDLSIGEQVLFRLFYHEI